MSKRSPLVFAATLAVSCASHPPRDPTPVTPPPAAPSIQTPAARQQPRTGVLVTYRGSTRIGEDSFHDDGETLTSDVKLGPAAMTIAITRSPRHVRVTAGSAPTDADVPVNTLVLENGDWQAYAIAAGWFDAAREPTPVRVMLPARGVTHDGK